MFSGGRIYNCIHPRKHWHHLGHSSTKKWCKSCAGQIICVCVIVEGKEASSCGGLMGWSCWWGIYPVIISHRAETNKDCSCLKLHMYTTFSLCQMFWIYTIKIPPKNLVTTPGPNYQPIEGHLSQGMTEFLPSLKINKCQLVVRVQANESLIIRITTFPLTPTPS